MLAGGGRATRQGGACRVLLQKKLSVHSSAPVRGCDVNELRVSGYEYYVRGKAGTGAARHVTGL